MKKSTKNWMIIGAVGVAGVAIWWIMRNRSQASSTSTTDPSIDPSTGLPYSQEYGGYGVGGGGSPYMYGYYDPNTGAYVTGSGSGGTVTTPSTNAEWAQQVEAYLQGLGYNPINVAAALGKYLTGQKLTANQMAIVQAAMGFYGNPPQGAPPPTQFPPHGQKPPPKPGDHDTTQITIHRGGTLKEIAAQRGWSNAFLRMVEQLDHLNARSRLKRGQHLTIPSGKVS